jgi:hypothetical protein
MRDEMRVLVLMTGFINILVTHTLLIIPNSQEIQRYRWFTNTPVHRCALHALGFSVSTNRLLSTDLHTGTVTSVSTNITSKIFQLHFRFSCTVAHKLFNSHNTCLQADLMYSPFRTVWPSLGKRKTELLAEQSSNLLPASSQHGHSWHRAPVGPMVIYLFNVKTFVFLFFNSLFLLW